MKILFVQKEGGIFGAENYHLDLIPGLLKQGFRIEFLRLYSNKQGGIDGEFVSRLSGFEVNVHQVNFELRNIPFAMLKVRKIVKIGEYDVIHTHLIHADFCLALIKVIYGFKAKLVSTKHGYDNDFLSRHGFNAGKKEKSLFYLISKWSEKRSDGSFAVSFGLRNFLVDIGIGDKNKMEVIHIGLNLPDNYKSKDNSSYRLANKQIIVVGRLVAFKGHELLLKALVPLKNRLNGGFKLVVLGTGPLEFSLKSLVNELGLIEYVEFLGYSDKAPEFMANSDVVVVPSISEAFGLIFLEAFSAKTPVVSWDVPSGNELLKNQITGYLVEPYNTLRMAECLEAILKGELSTTEVIENAFSMLHRYYVVDRMVNETISFYNKILFK
jgi:glycosyltransferase involved in cell wall biosynthesis